MARYVTVSGKVPSELRERMREFGIKPSQLLRRAIEEEVRRREIDRIKASIKQLKPTLERVTVEEAVRSIRQDREQR